MKLLHSVIWIFTVGFEDNVLAFSEADLRPSTSGPELPPMTSRACSSFTTRLPGALHRGSHAASRGPHASVHCGPHSTAALALVDLLQTAQTDALAAGLYWEPSTPSPPSAISQPRNTCNQPLGTTMTVQPRRLIENLKRRRNKSKNKPASA